MKKLGNGWQYTVYDLGNGRVLKKFHSLIKLFFSILRTTGSHALYFVIFKYMKNMKKKARHSFDLLKTTIVPDE